MSQTETSPTRERSPVSEPKYSMIPRLLTPHIDPGDEIEIHFYFSGTGEIQENKLGIIHEYPDLVVDGNDEDNENDNSDENTSISNQLVNYLSDKNDKIPGTLEDNCRIRPSCDNREIINIIEREDSSIADIEEAIEGYNDSTEELIDILEENPEEQGFEHRMGSVGTFGEVPLLCFAEYPKEEAPEFLTENRISLVVGEKRIADRPPICVRLNTSSKIEPGYYNIACVFTYRGENIVRQDIKNINIHVRS